MHMGYALAGILMIGYQCCIVFNNKAVENKGMHLMHVHMLHLLTPVISAFYLHLGQKKAVSLPTN